MVNGMSEQYFQSFFFIFFSIWCPCWAVLHLLCFPEGSSETHTPELESPPQQSLMDRMWERILQAVYSIMDDFTDLPLEEPKGDPEGDPLTVKK